jgi:hypothetical protein
MIFRPFEMLSALAAAQVEFIIVGGVAGRLHRASVLTEDLDIVHHRTPENIERLMAVIEQMDAYFRHDLARRKLRPMPSDLAGNGHVLLQTPHGHMDVLCELSGQRGYDELLPHSIVIADRGLRLQVLDLPTLIQVKIEAGRPKDKAAVPILIAALESQKKPEG